MNRPGIGDQRRAPRRHALGVVTPLGVRVEVADGTRDPPVVKTSAPGELGGRGMLIVNHFADNWGTEPIPDGKLVWFELSLVGDQ
jgi:hypothetical protein